MSWRNGLEVFYSAPRKSQPIVGIDDLKGNPVVHWCGFDSSSVPWTEQRELATILAAAPDMLTALKRAEAVWGDSMTGNGADGETMACIRTAIAKATSQSSAEGTQK